MGSKDQPLGTLQVDECAEELLVRYAEKDFFGGDSSAQSWGEVFGMQPGYLVSDFKLR